jgi:protein-tyrosine phosphatase
MDKTSVLFVCMGNICRSPTAEGVFRNLVEKEGLADRFLIDSAGTHAYHVGEPPDERARRAASSRGIELGGLRARQVRFADFRDFDHILVMDADNRDALLFMQPGEHARKIGLLLDYAPRLKIKEVPDPYYGGAQGFEKVLDMIEAASEGFLRTLKESWEP